MRARSLVVALFFLSTALSAQATWTIDAKPILDVAGTKSGNAVVFGAATGATRLGNGSLLIADGPSSAVRLIDSKGALVKTSGRMGQGPGEFQSMMWAGRCGPDSLLIWDGRRAQMSMVGADGTIGRQFRFPTDTARVVNPLGSAFACDGNIAYVAHPLRRPETPDGVITTYASIVTTDREGKVTDHVDDLPTGQMIRAGRGGAFPRPLGAAAFVAVVGSRIVLGSSDSARLIVHRPGERPARLAVPYTPRAPTSQEMSDAFESIASMAPAAARQQVIDLLAAAPKTTVMPPFFALLGDPDGLLWVQTSSPGAKQTSFIVMRLEGQVVARATLPMAATVTEVGRDYLLASYSDVNDEQHVAVFKLTRR